MDYQYILGGIILLASSLAFVFILYSFGEKKKNKVVEEGSSYAKISSENGICSQEVEEGETDIIIVGAGVAGAALAYTLGKVYMFVLISSYEFMHLICLYVVI
jgi:squalene monooxygenase